MAVRDVADARQPVDVLVVDETGQLGQATSAIRREPPEEAALVVSTIRRLLGREWTDRHGVTRLLTSADFMVVTM